MNETIATYEDLLQRIRRKLRDLSNEDKAGPLARFDHLAPIDRLALGRLQSLINQVEEGAGKVDHLRVELETTEQQLERNADDAEGLLEFLNGAKGRVKPTPPPAKDDR